MKTNHQPSDSHDRHRYGFPESRRGAILLMRGTGPFAHRNLLVCNTDWTFTTHWGEERKGRWGAQAVNISHDTVMGPPRKDHLAPLQSHSFLQEGHVWLWTGPCPRTYSHQEWSTRVSVPKEGLLLSVMYTCSLSNTKGFRWARFRLGMVPHRQSPGSPRPSEEPFLFSPLGNITWGKRRVRRWSKLPISSLWELKAKFFLSLCGNIIPKNEYINNR